MRDIGKEFRVCVGVLGQQKLPFVNRTRPQAGEARPKKDEFRWDPHVDPLEALLGKSLKQHP